MSSPKIETLIKCPCSTVGEGPYWDEPTKSLVFVDISCGGILRWDSSTGKTDKIYIDKTVGFAIPCERGGLVAGVAKTASHVDWNTKAVTCLAEVDADKITRMNDAKCDAAGRLWAGTTGWGMKGSPPYCSSLYSITPDYKVTQQVPDVDISNGMDWTEDNKIMYFIDSTPRKVFAFDFDLEKGQISNKRTVVEFQPDSIAEYGVPDGMTIDQEGKIWVACFGANRVHRFDPETGKTLQTLKFPAKNITSVCFGGEKYDELFVTSAKTMDDEFPLAGSVFRVTGLGVKGRPAYPYKG